MTILMEHKTQASCILCMHEFHHKQLKLPWSIFWSMIFNTNNIATCNIISLVNTFVCVTLNYPKYRCIPLWYVKLIACIDCTTTPLCYNRLSVLLQITSSLLAKTSIVEQWNNHICVMMNSIVTLFDNHPRQCVCH